MNNKTKVLVTGGILLGIAGAVMLSPWSLVKHVDANTSSSVTAEATKAAVVAHVTTSALPLDLNQLDQKRVHFKIAKNLNDSKISSDQAVSIVQGMFNTPYQPMDATFGYLTLDKVGSPLIPDHLTAGKINHGVVSNYPVWIVRVKGLRLESQGPSNENGQANSKTEWNSVYTLVDATTGEIFYSISMQQN